MLRFSTSDLYRTSEVKSDIFEAVTENETVAIDNATVCMIDICGFSTWCSYQIPKRVVDAMSRYNLFLTETMSAYPDLTKIELVGDCCMVVGGLTNDVPQQDATLQTIRFAVDVLQNLDRMHDIFSDVSIGVRIGIHVSDVFGIMMPNPKRFQLYGNDINVCSRLESSAPPNTAHISLKTIVATQGLCNAICGPCASCVRSTMSTKTYKGVGEQRSFVFHVKKDKLLWYHDVHMKVKKLLTCFPDHVSTTQIGDTSFQPIMSFFWNHVIIFAETAEHLQTYLAAIFDFRVWERRRISQNITLVVPHALIHKITAHHKEICHIVRDDDEDINTLAEKLRYGITTYRNIDNTRSSIDLHTCS